MAFPVALVADSLPFGDWRQGTDSSGLQPHPEQVCGACDGSVLMKWRGLFLFDAIHDRLITAKAFIFGVSPSFLPPSPPPLTPQIMRLFRHLVFVRWLRCIILMIAGEHLLALEWLERRPWGTKWPHPVYIFITALLTYLLTSGKNLQVTLLGSFSKK